MKKQRLQDKYPNRTMEEWNQIIQDDIDNLKASIVHWQWYNVSYDGQLLTSVQAEDSTDAIDYTASAWAGDKSKYTATLREEVQA